MGQPLPLAPRRHWFPSRSVTALAFLLGAAAASRAEPTSTDAKDPVAAESASPKKEKPKYTPDLKKITLSLSRFKGDTVVISKSIDYSHKHETVGYSFGVTNRNIYPVEKIRVEYNLFARPYDGATSPIVVAGALDFPPVATGRTETMKGKTAEICRLRGIDYKANGGELRGVWVKLFLGDQLVQEIPPSDTIRGDFTWKAPEKTGDGAGR